VNLRILKVGDRRAVIEVGKAAPAPAPAPPAVPSFLERFVSPHEAVMKATPRRPSEVTVDEAAFIREMEAIIAEALGRSSSTAALTPHEVVMKAAGEAYRSYAADQTNGGMPPGIGAGTPTPSVPQTVMISATAPATSTPSVPEDKVLETISVDDLRREETPDEQTFVPYAVRAATDLAKVRKNARRSREFANPRDLARDV
jgi:hypothetical protein